MNITFTPLKDPAPVRPADMPEGVAFDMEYQGHISVAVRVGLCLRYAHPETEEALPGYYRCDVNSMNVGRVLRRRDGKPLPGPEPVPLGTLEPFPVWYRRGPGHTWWYQHDGVGGYTVYTEHTGEIEMHGGKGKNINVSPTPYIMEVRP